jgi:iron only hydrogenase large subunit-like protein
MNTPNNKGNLGLVPVIHVDEEKCVNCHMCIAVCPVKYCIDGSGEKVSINHDLCIGCGNCVKACTQKARTIKDDTDAFMDALRRKEKIVAVAAPALASSYPNNYKRVLGWLKNAGVAAFFDVSFGAELTVKSYIDHIGHNSPSLMISQPCPAIVNYVEIYRPELLRHLAPSDSPMLHTIKMIREFYPQYAGHKTAMLSPCAAKRREFDETGVGDYNVTLKSLQSYMESRGVKLDRQPEAEFDNPPAERAVLFSSPGGLLRTAEREVPGIASRTRKIEGPDLVYDYLSSLPASLAEGRNPLLVDCLNCDYGCNAGPGTLNQGKSPDEIEHPIEKRRAEAEALYGGKRANPRKAKKKLSKVLSNFWKPGLYARNYIDRSANYRLAMPNDRQFAEIYDSMMKKRQEDHLNCASCGYKSCRGMAIAIFNGLNKKENCHLYRQCVIEQEKDVIAEANEQLHREITAATGMADSVRANLRRLEEQSESQFRAIEESAAAVKQMIATLADASGIASGKRTQIAGLAEKAVAEERDMAATVDAIRSASQGVSGIGELIDVIHDVADETNLLAMNAAIQAAHAGVAGKSFAVVAGEIRKLAENTGGNARRISESLGSIVKQIQSSDEMTIKTGSGIKEMAGGVARMADEMGSLINSLGEISSGGTQVTQGIEDLRLLSLDVKDNYSAMASEINGILTRIHEIAEISDSTRKTITDLD